MQEEMQNPLGPASDAQMRFMRGLIREREQAFFGEEILESSMCLAMANGLISFLARQPRKEGIERVGVGLYAKDDKFVLVVVGKQNPDRRYGKVLMRKGNAWKWEYLRGVIEGLTSDDMLTPEEIEHFGLARR